MSNAVAIPDYQSTDDTGAISDDAIIRQDPYAIPVTYRPPPLPAYHEPVTAIFEEVRPSLASKLRNGAITFLIAAVYFPTLLGVWIFCAAYLLYLLGQGWGQIVFMTIDILTGVHQ